MCLYATFHDPIPNYNSSITIVIVNYSLQLTKSTQIMY